MDRRTIDRLGRQLEASRQELAGLRGRERLFET
jgi:hypothetical protein